MSRFQFAFVKTAQMTAWERARFLGADHVKVAAFNPEVVRDLDYEDLAAVGLTPRERDEAARQVAQKASRSAGGAGARRSGPDPHAIVDMTDEQLSAAGLNPNRARRAAQNEINSGRAGPRPSASGRSRPPAKSGTREESWAQKLLNEFSEPSASAPSALAGALRAPSAEAPGLKVRMMGSEYPVRYGLGIGSAPAAPAHHEAAPHAPASPAAPAHHEAAPHAPASPAAPAGKSRKGLLAALAALGGTGAAAGGFALHRKHQQVQARANRNKALKGLALGGALGLGGIGLAQALNPSDQD
jgi:hypothetical protein